ncbi:MAG: 30S ribosomal protein S6 [Planctomycetota bacterium]
METVDRKRYEAMFLVDSVQAQNWDAIIKTVKTILEKAEAEIVSIDKWGDRRLAYEIKGKTRGTYILCYFRADGDRIGGIERDVQLSERIMRVLILSDETREKQDIEKALISQKVVAEGRDEEAHISQKGAAEGKDEASKLPE